MEFEGVVVQLLPVVKGTGARGEWVKQEVIFEQAGEFGRKICVSFWGDKAMDAASLKPGDSVKVSVNIESREYNGRWYTEVRAWKFNAGGQGAASPRFEEPYGASGFPSNTASANTPPLSDEEPLKEDFDDLPF